MSQLVGDDHSDDENDYFIPLEDQRVFGAGIKRKGIAFVSATSTNNNDNISPQQNRPKTDSGLGDRYLAIVFGKANLAQQRTGNDETNTNTNNRIKTSDTTKEPEIRCEICKEPIHHSSNPENSASRTSHESSITHQVCLTHSHPPSHLDRDHIGLKYLSGYGWDPDARTGLGAQREGIRAPIKAKEKRDTAGLGVSMVDEDDDVMGTTGISTKKKIKLQKQSKIIKVDAGAVRKLETEKKKRAEKLRQTFYGDDLSKYLGPDG